MSCWRDVRLWAGCIVLKMIELPFPRLSVLPPILPDMLVISALYVIFAILDLPFYFVRNHTPTASRRLCVSLVCPFSVSWASSPLPSWLSSLVFM